MIRTVSGALMAGALSLMVACGTKDKSPAIVCDVNGTLMATSFTFDGFRDTLIAEHGTVEAKANESLKTPSVEVYFKAVASGKLLATRVYLPKLKQEVPPALLFGLDQGGAPVPVAPAVPLPNVAVPAMNVPAAPQTQAVVR